MHHGSRHGRGGRIGPGLLPLFLPRGGQSESLSRNVADAATGSTRRQYGVAPRRRPGPAIFCDVRAGRGRAVSGPGGEPLGHRSSVFAQGRLLSDQRGTGTIVIDPQRHFLYLVQEGGRAIRYGVGVGRQGFGWSGIATIHDKQEWPDWYPPKEMIQRQPELMKVMSELQSGIGMHGGPRNPLGARAMYLWQGNKDTLFRIHGTVEPWTIGKSVSSGCIRMINQDVIDLYQRTPVGNKVVVLASRAG
ncbi:MAG TPA: L,D-transpeptidase [Xanthobacteraceae bacterium]|nr:L,D-transpeptidase [Xanthobacteraceae bacterium]